jgi:hypothetical protein
MRDSITGENAVRKLDPSRRARAEGYQQPSQLSGSTIRWVQKMTSMGEHSKHLRLKFTAIVLLLNGAFWVYFWACFIAASRPNDGSFCMDHCYDPYVFFGRGIGLAMNPLAHQFMKLMVALELPSFSIATLLQNMLTGQPTQRLFVGVLGDFGYRLFPGFPNGSGGRLFLGISINGYRLLATMLLSFLQWVLIAKFLSWLTRKFTGTSGSRSEV